MKRLLIMIILMFLNSAIVYGQETFLLRNEIDLNLSMAVSKTISSFSYSFELRNGINASQSIWLFWILLNDKIIISNQQSPPGWRFSAGIDNNTLILSWASVGNFNIAPEDSISGFIYASSALPGIAFYYAEGYAPPPSFEPGMAPDSIPGYDDLTPYGPGVVGKTVGPVLAPSTFDSVAFVDTLISYKHQAFNLGWITSQGIANSLDTKLDEAKKQLQKGKTTPAINILQALINEVEAQNGKKLTSEAYALLKFNAEFLIEKLSQP